MKVASQGRFWGSQTGFSLLEVLVALAIAAMVAGVALPAVWQSMARQQDANVRLMAFDLANSKLQEFSAVSQRKDVPTEGTVNGLHWRVAAGSAVEPVGAGLVAAISLENFQVEVAGIGETEPLVSLSAIRLKPKVD